VSKALALVPVVDLLVAALFDLDMITPNALIQDDSFSKKYLQ
jgi:hypothetical protein